MRLPDGEERGKKVEILFEEIMAENFPNLGRKQTSRSRKPRQFQTGGIQRDDTKTHYN